MNKYLDRLDDSEIEQFLKAHNLYLFNDNYDDNNNPIPPIQRGKNLIIARCINEDADKKQAKAYGFINGLDPFYNGFKSSDLIYEIVSIDDFFIQLLKDDDVLDKFDEKLFVDFHDMMLQKFGEEYKKDFKQCVKSIKENVNPEKSYKDNDMEL